MDNFYEASQKTNIYVERTPVVVIRTKMDSSPCSVIKIYWDAAVDKSRKKMDMGVIVWDYEEKVLATIYLSKMHVYN